MAEELKVRTRQFAVRVIRLYGSLPPTVEAQVIGKQLIRSGTSIGAHYREAQHAKSDADFISKLEGALQELEETSYWLELVDEIALFDPHKTLPLRAEAKELTAILVSIVKKVKARRQS